MTKSVHDDTLTRGMALPVAIRSMHAKGLILLPAAVIVLVVAAQFASSTMALKLTLWISFSICALSLDFVWGKAGIFSFGQNAVFGLGGYAYAVIALNLFPDSQETISALLGAGLVGAFSSALLGYFLFYGRLSDVYLSIVTLAVTLIIYTVLASTAGPEYHIGEALLGGFNGIPSLPGIAFPTLFGMGGAGALDPQAFDVRDPVRRRNLFRAAVACAQSLRSDDRRAAFERIADGTARIRRP